MDIVKLGIVLLSIVVVFILLYVVVFAILKPNRGNEKERTILKHLKTYSCKEDCSLCNGNCDKFAKGVAGGIKSINDCPKLSNSTQNELKNMLELQPKVDARKVAVVLCRGGKRASNQYDYKGANMCDYSNKLFGGFKSCGDACLGCMDCAKVCPTGAIKKNRYGVAEVDSSLCIGCGECVKQCPDNLITMISPGQKVLIACKKFYSTQNSSNINQVCSVGCTKCGVCVKVCPTGAIKKEDGKIVFDKQKCNGCNACVYACPNNTITILKKDFMKF